MPERYDLFRAYQPEHVVGGNRWIRIRMPDGGTQFHFYRFKDFPVNLGSSGHFEIRKRGMRQKQKQPSGCWPMGKPDICRFRVPETEPRNSPDLRRTIAEG